jgi:hypothetical protein
MSLRFVNGKWKGGTKKDAAKLKASSKISSSNKSSSSSGSKKSYGSYNQNQSAAYPQADAMMGTNMAETYAKAYGASNKMQGPLMESGAFYSKESSDSDRNKKISSDRNNAYSAATKKTTSPSSNRSLASIYNKFKNFVNTAPQRVGTGGYISNLINKGAAEAGGLWDTLRGEGLANTVEQLGRDISLGFKNAGGLVGKAEAYEQPYVDQVDERRKEQDAYELMLKNRGYSEDNARLVSQGAPNPYVNSSGSYVGPKNKDGSDNIVKTFDTSSDTNLAVNPIDTLTSNALAPQNNQYDFTPIAPENATVQGLGGRGIFSSGQYANGKGNYGIEGSFGTGIEEDNSILSDLKGLLGNTANAQTVEDQSSYYDPSIANMIDNSRYNYMAANPTQSYVWGENPNAPYIANEAYNEPQGGENRSYNSSSNYQAPSNAGVATSPYDAYMQQQAKGYDKMIKAQKKALKEQLKAIKKQYEEAEKEGTESLNKQKFEDLLRLQGMFSFANSDPNDEQRIQYTTRTANDYATQLSTFLRKLASEKSTALKTANTEGSNALAELEQQKAAAQMKVAQIIWEAQQKAARSAYSGYNPSATSEDDSLGLW